MATTPRFLSPDGQHRTELTLTTTSTSRFLQGDLPTDTADVQVSIRGGAFTSDPDLIFFVGTQFTVPNPASFSDGLGLVPGENEVKVRAVLTSGGLSPVATATVSLVSNQSAIDAQPPTGISVERDFNDITINVVGLTSTQVTGYNFYCSTDPGGGALGYTRINANTVTDSNTITQSSPLYNLFVQSTSQSADPLFFEFQAQQENSAGSVLQVDALERVEIPETVSSFETTVAINALNTINLFAFTHNRNASITSSPPTIPSSSFSNLLNTDPLYYVVTAVYFDAESGTEVESFQSPEVVANPVSIQANVGSLPTPSRQTLLENIVVSIARSRPDIALQPGSVLRDTVIDPLTSELERLQFVVDFLYRASSFATLLDVDDPFDSGTSLPVQDSAYKQALKQAFFLTNNDSVQQVIDNAFEKLASNFGLSRLAGSRARGEVTFFTLSTPTRTLSVPLGTSLSNGDFQTSEAVSIPFSTAASFFDPTTGRYSVTASVEAVSVGSRFNLTSGQITTGAPLGLSATNVAPTFGGRDLETNAQLASRSLRVLSSVDSGTQRGYLQVAASSPGVIEADVVSAGDLLMQRDLDPTTLTHTGGKVDIWIQGNQVTPVTDTFAFSFEIKQDIQFVVIGDPADYTFRAIDPNLSITNPILEMLNYPTINFGLRNATTGLDFDLTGVQITSFNIIQLSTAVAQPPVTLTDVVLGDYRYQTSERFVPTRQPVNQLTSLVGEVTGTVNTSVYKLVRPSSPLDLGRSKEAGDYLLLTDPKDSTVTVPSGAPIAITGEEHVLVGEYLEFVNKLGAVSLTLVVANSAGVPYVSPFDPAGSPDYTIIEGNQTTAISIRRTQTSNITSGETVTFSYSHDENFTLGYETNIVVASVQSDVDAIRHVTADVLVKEAISVPVDITATIVTSVGSPSSEVDIALRTNLNNLIDSLRPGDSLRESDVVDALDGTAGVSYVVLPLTKMVKATGASVTREEIVTSQPVDTFLVSGWSTSTVNVWLVKDALESATTTGGGSTGDFVGVFQNELEMTLQLTTPSGLGGGSTRAFIIGKEGLSIPGYSDDATLTAEGYTTISERAARRSEITGNRILITLAVGESPTASVFSVTYVVGSDTGTKDINVNSIAYLTSGTFEFTFDEDRPQRSTLRLR